jgi:hypothetical protein
MTLTKKTDHVIEAKDNLVEQFKKSPKMQAFIAAFADQVQDLEDAFFEVFEERWIDTAVGVQLDGLGAIVGEDREGRGDDEYRLAIKARIQINFSEATPEDMLLALTNFYAATYELVETNYASFVIRFVDEWVEGTDPDPVDFLNLLNQINGAGIAAWFQYVGYDDDDVFTFASGDTVEASTTQGWADDPLWVAMRNTVVNDAAQYSSDRITWTTKSITTNTWQDIIACSRLRKFIGFSNDGTNRAIETGDGSSWSALTPDTAAWIDAVWSPELRIAVAIDTDKVTTWDGVGFRTYSITSKTWKAIAWSPTLGKFCAVDGSKAVLLSSDGVTWTDVVGQSGTWTDVCWSEELSLFVAVASSGTKAVQTSPDGENWTIRTVAGNSWQTVVWSAYHGMFIAMGTSSGQYMYSADGITWTIVSTGKSWRVNEVVEFGGQFLGVGTSGGLDTTVYSDDGHFWEENIGATADDWDTVAHGIMSGGVMSEITGG